MKTLTLYNTLSRTKSPVQPNAQGVVGLYACGFTVYDYTHLGHLRKYSMDDILVRTLRHFGYTVNFVRNITDVGHLASDEDTGEDKLEKGAKKYGKSVWEVAREFEDYFVKSMDTMGNLRPDVSCRATEHIPEQLQMVLELEKKGYTYVIPDDGVYFDTSKLTDYGELAQLDHSKLQAGSRVEMVVGKRNATDFALWKFERAGENRAMVWESPWHQRSFPGWHIECSAMAMRYLGEQFEIHTGGIDHIPVHHVNEIAQAEAATGKKPFVQHWVHHNFLRIDGEKMSKSLGNFYTIDDILERGISPRALRLLLLTAHYRSEINFTWQNLMGAQKSYEKLLRFCGQLLEDAVVATDMSETPIDPDKLDKNAKEWYNRFFSALSDDLDTPTAVSVLWQLVKDAQVGNAEKYALIREFDVVLQLDVFSVPQERMSDSMQAAADENIPAEVAELLEARAAARAQKDFAQADVLRDKLQALGYQVFDTAEGQKVERVEPNP